MCIPLLIQLGLHLRYMPGTRVPSIYTLCHEFAAHFVHSLAHGPRPTWLGRRMTWAKASMGHSPGPAPATHIRAGLAHNLDLLHSWALAPAATFEGSGNGSGRAFGAMSQILAHL